MIVFVFFHSFGSWWIVQMVSTTVYDSTNALEICDFRSSESRLERILNNPPTAETVSKLRYHRASAAWCFSFDLESAVTIRDRYHRL